MIQVINRAVDIIEYIAIDSTRPKLMGHIADDLNLNTATCANILKTLVNRGLIKKSEYEKGYILGERLIEIANGSVGLNDLLSKASVEMEKAEQLIGENNLIAILKKNQRIVIKRKNNNELIQATTPDQKNAYDSSTGRLLIAMLSDKELNLYIKRYGLPDKKIWAEADNTSKFLEKVDIIRKQGYELIEDSVQIVGISTPIYRNEKVIASFSIYLPSFRFNDQVREKMIITAIGVSKNLSV